MIVLTEKDFLEAEKNGVSRKNLSQRFYHLGWDLQEAKTKKPIHRKVVNRRRDKQKEVRVKPKGPSLSDIEAKAREKRMSYGEYVAHYN